MTAEELGVLATQLASSADPAEATRLKELLTRGFYGTSASRRGHGDGPQAEASGLSGAAVDLSLARLSAAQRRPGGT